ncbi:hypothetical protein ATCC90586_012121 [Pythium insidiosum]|nr:hypothetical protein ATCC90586_012121 [Pythium insidiosum]
MQQRPLPSCRTATTLALCGGDVRVVVSLIDPQLTALHAMVLFKSWTFLSGTGSLDLSFGYLEIDDTVDPEQPETTPVIQPEEIWEKLLQDRENSAIVELLVSVRIDGRNLALFWAASPTPDIDLVIFANDYACLSDDVTMAKLQQATIEVSDSERSMSVRELFFHADYSESTTNIHKSRLVSIVEVIQGLLREKDRGRLHCITLPSTIMSI